MWDDILEIILEGVLKISIDAADHNSFIGCIGIIVVLQNQAIPEN